jgi:hypothetical protein
MSFAIRGRWEWPGVTTARRKPPNGSIKNDTERLEGDPKLATAYALVALS